MEIVSPPSAKIVTSAGKIVVKPRRRSCKSPAAKPTLEIRLPLHKNTNPNEAPQPSPPPIKPTSIDANRIVGNVIRTSKIKNRGSTADILRLMDNLSLPIPLDIYASLIKECTAVRDGDGALELLAHIRRSRLRPTLFLLNRLVLMLASCGHVDTARQLFDRMTPKNFNSWAIMIVAYLDIGDYEEAIAFFVKMQSCKFMPEFPAWIMVCIVKACILTKNMELGKQLHGQLLKLGAGNDLSVSGSIINFYGRFNCMDDAGSVFGQLSRHNTVIWTAKIVNSCREGQVNEVIDDFNKMGREGIKKNGFTFSSVLKACAQMEDHGNCGRQLHANAIKLGVEYDGFVQCGLIDMYGKCGLLTDAERAFEMISDKRNIACWNAMLTSYIHNGACVTAVKFLYQMKEAGFKIQESMINEVKIVCASSTPTKMAEETSW